MPLFDPNDPNNSQPQADADQQPVQNTAAPAATAPAPVSAPVSSPAPSQQPQQAATPPQQPSQPRQPQAAQPPQSGVVTNAPVPAAVQHASVLRQVAETLAGGPRFTTTIDTQTGATTRTKVPLSRSDLGLAIAMSAITGALSGLSLTGPGATGRAAAAGFEQTSQQRQQADAQQQQQVQQQYENQSSALVRKASIYETNARAMLNTSEAEQQGADAIDKLVSINRASGVLDTDPALLDNNGQPMTQNELLDAMKSGKLSPTDQLGPVAGRIEITNPDGTKRWEAVHLVIKDPQTPVTLNQDQWDRLAAAGVPGFPSGTKIGQGIEIPLRMMQSANEIAASHYLAGQRLDDLRDVLDGTPQAKQVPAGIDFAKPGVNAGLSRFQRYVSHNSDNLNDPFLALQQMGAAKRDPQTGQMQPNPDAKYVDAVASVFGGWPVLQAAHNQIEANKKTASDFAVIDTADKANAVIAAPKRFTTDQVSAAHNFIALANQQGASKAAQEARARAVAEGADVQAMYRFGRNPITGEQLTVNNAPDSMLISASGQVIPQDLVSTFKPSAQEKQTADTARQVLAISAGLQQALQQNPNLAGPLSGRSKAGIAKLGFGDAQAQKFLDDISFLQSAATKMHTGRFSNEILKKMDNIIQPGMNPDQFTGALASINGVASRYADEDKLRTVADFKQQAATPQNPNPGSGRQVQIPAGAQIGRDAQGNVVGYRLNGQYIPIGGQQ